MSILKYESSIEIVRTALGASKTDAKSLNANVRLGDVLKNDKHRELFLRGVHKLLTSQGYIIEINQIPNEPHHTIRHVAETIADFAALPGKTGKKEGSADDDTD